MRHIEEDRVSPAPARPRVAVIGGGGAMGRLFARLFLGAASELYLFDFFDAPTGPSMLDKLLDELAGAASGTPARIDTLTRAADGRTWRAMPAGPPARGRALLRFGAAPSPDEDVAESLAEIVDRRAASADAGCTVVAALPEDAPDLLPRADITLLAVGLEGKSSLAETVRFYAPWLRPASLVVDLGSTKTRSLEILGETLDPAVGVLGAHPLFGPAVSNLTGLIVAVVDPANARPASPWRAWFLDHLARLHFIVTPATADEHDDAMSFVQALTHFTLLAFAYSFVRLNRDPADLLAFRTPVFEPLLYLAARVAHLARVNPDTYRSIQRHTARPAVRAAFLDAAREILAAIEQVEPGDAQRPAEPGATDPLAELFGHYGAPWSPDRRGRRERERREHFLEMGAHLVDGLNRLRQEVVAAAGRVRAIEETRIGQRPRVSVGIVDLDLLDPGRQDVSSRIRLRPLNLLLGSAQAEARSIPLARARILTNAELLDWLLAQDLLVERRTVELLIPDWFDREILLRLLKRSPEPGEVAISRIWDVAVEPSEARMDPPPGQQLARLTLAIVIDPAEVVRLRREAEPAEAAALGRERDEAERRLDAVRRELDAATDSTAQRELRRAQDRLKHERKRLLDQQTARLDRAVRQQTRRRAQGIYQDAVDWLNRRGCGPAR